LDESGSDNVNDSPVDMATTLPSRFSDIKNKDALKEFDKVDGLANDKENHLFPFFLTVSAIVKAIFDRTKDINVRTLVRGVSWTETEETIALFGVPDSDERNVGWILKQLVYRLIPLAVGKFFFFENYAKCY